MTISKKKLEVAKEDINAENRRIRNDGNPRNVAPAVNFST